MQKQAVQNIITNFTYIYMCSLLDNSVSYQKSWVRIPYGSRTFQCPMACPSNINFNVCQCKNIMYSKYTGIVQISFWHMLYFRLFSIFIHCSFSDIKFAFYKNEMVKSVHFFCDENFLSLLFLQNDNTVFHTNVLLAS